MFLHEVHVDLGSGLLKFVIPTQAEKWGLWGWTRTGLSFPRPSSSQSQASGAGNSMVSSRSPVLEPPAEAAQSGKSRSHPVGEVSASAKGTA